ncbi:hypothetical protein [Parabacteroides goldsteinii]|uniref:hypothetical protein n=1 Tax=Parabacteroides goldsteinii TaxID=328812 RepID=UPI002165CBFB|nr:hypothetical protein [Parabacteroides goldsteinii]MCS2425074.1 hypothetical protein [Parabacteroides goldsteinii]
MIIITVLVNIYISMPFDATLVPHDAMSFNVRNTLIPKFYLRLTPTLVQLKYSLWIKNRKTKKYCLLLTRTMAAS